MIKVRISVNSCLPQAEARANVTGFEGNIIAT